MDRDKARQLVTVFGAVGVLLTVAALAVGQPLPPNSYYGVAETSERVAPQGTTIVAVANGERQDAITVGSDGQYGSRSGEKLRVSSDIDSEVTFHVGDANGTQARQTDPNPTAEVEELDLTFPDGAFDDTSPTQTFTPTPTSDSTSTPTSESTATTTATSTATPTTTGTATGTATATTGTATATTATATATEGATRSTTADGSTSDDRTRPSTPLPTVSGSPDVSVTGATVNRTEAPVGGVVLVNATLRNEGTGSANGSVKLYANGTAVSDADYTIAPGETEQMQFRYRANETGVVQLSVGPKTAGTVTVGNGGGGGLIPWGLLRTIALYVALPIALIYGVLKALAIYYGY
ncbi:hypothetical protein [Haloarcula sediminis]|uniref:hypothetical protein n=1 Tax=Haloarcula sediminis TaxID=3111777 RepID=UPI002D7807D5|nr:hypothetical protein [Haloarcula sp. CK38]